MPTTLQPSHALLCFILLAASTGLAGCEGTCTALDIETTLDPITAEEQALTDEYGYFNLTADCETEPLTCQEFLPDLCEDACAPGMTCIQVELRVDACGGNPFLPNVNPGDHWVRKCLELPAEDAADLLASPVEPVSEDVLFAY
jgi:hypothetical protein